MISFLRRWIVLWIGIPLIVLIAIQPNLRKQLGLTSPPPPPSSWLVSEAPESARIAHKRAISKDQVVDRFFAGELTLLEAAAWFRYLNDNPIDAPSNFRTHWRGKSDGEKLCRQLICWIELRLRDTMPTSQVEPIVEQMLADVDARLAETGTIELPW